MIKTQIDLGVLSMPLILGTLGVVPGNMLIVIIASITTRSSYTIGKFKIRHPDVYGIGDVGGMFFGRVGYELFGGVYALDFTFTAGSSVVESRAKH